MRPIDADNLISVLDILSDKGGDIRYWEQLKWIVADCPTADVRKVVRCKECIFHSDSFVLNGRYKCLNFDLCTDDEFYCGFGAKMDEVEE